MPSFWSSLIWKPVFAWLGSWCMENNGTHNSFLNLLKKICQSLLCNAGARTVALGHFQELLMIMMELSWLFYLIISCHHHYFCLCRSLTLVLSGWVQMAHRYNVAVSVLYCLFFCVVFKYCCCIETDLGPLQYKYYIIHILHISLNVNFLSWLHWHFYLWDDNKMIIKSIRMKRAKNGRKRKRKVDHGMEFGDIQPIWSYSPNPHFLYCLKGRKGNKGSTLTKQNSQMRLDKCIR